jgi:L-iditol 2-dehydrogenase
MKQASFLGDDKVTFEDVDIPRALDDWAVIKVTVAPLCTEYKQFYAGQTTGRIGHEAAGEVIESGPKATVLPGDRVVVMPSLACGRCKLCASGFYVHCQNWHDYEAIQGSTAGIGTVTQYLARPSFLMLPVPYEIPIEQAALAGCALGPTFGAMQKLNVTASDTVLISGLGPVGLGGIVNGVFRGARVIATDPAPWRLQRARQMGIEDVFDPTQGDGLSRILDLTDGEGVDYAIDCSGNIAAHRLSINATRRLGAIAFVGECHDPLSINISNDMLRKGISLVGNWHYNRKDYDKLLQVIRKSNLLNLLVSHRLPMEQIDLAFKVQQTTESAKILLFPWEPTAT